MARTLARGKPQKGRSVRKFRREVKKTHPKNVAPGPARGGIRL